MPFPIIFSEDEFAEKKALIEQKAKKSSLELTHLVKFSPSKCTIQFKKSVYHSGVLFPEFFQSLPQIQKKINQDLLAIKQIEANQAKTRRRQNAGIRVPAALSNNGYNVTNIMHNGALSLRSYDLGLEDISQSRLAADKIKLAAIQLPAKPEVSAICSGSDEELIVNLLENHTNLVIGENHGDISPKRFFVAHATVLKKQGVTTLYMEHLLADDHQHLLNDWAYGEKMPKELELYLDNLDKGMGISANYPDNFKGMIEAVHEAEIRIIAIDDSCTYIRPEAQAHYSADRYLLMNMNAKTIIDNDRKDNEGKYIVFCGTGHVGTRRDIPGIDELLGIPGVVMTDLSDPGPRTISTNVNNGERGVIASVQIAQHAISRQEELALKKEEQRVKKIQSMIFNEEELSNDGTVLLTLFKKETQEEDVSLLADNLISACNKEQGNYLSNLEKIFLKIGRTYIEATIRKIAQLRLADKVKSLALNTLFNSIENDTEKKNIIYQLAAHYSRPTNKNLISEIIFKELLEGLDDNYLKDYATLPKELKTQLNKDQANQSYHGQFLRHIGNIQLNTIREILIGSADAHVVWCTENKKKSKPSFFNRLLNKDAGSVSETEDFKASLQQAKIEEVLDFLKEHFQGHPKLNEHSLGRYLLEGLAKTKEVKTLLGIDIDAINLNNSKGRATFRDNIIGCNAKIECR